jgi:hypothetical protein
MKLHKGLFAVFAIALLGAGFVSAFGWMNNDNQDAIESAIESGDFNIWKEAHLAQLTEENFNLAVERHEQMTEMKELMNSLREAKESGDEDLIAELTIQIEELRPEGFNEMKGSRRNNEFKEGKGKMFMNEDCPFSE